MVFIRLFTDAGVRKFGKKKCLYLGLLCSFLATLSYDMFTSIYSLIVARILHGIGFGLSTTFAAALVADVIPAQRRGWRRHWLFWSWQYSGYGCSSCFRCYVID